MMMLRTLTMVLLVSMVMMIKRELHDAVERKRKRVHLRVMLEVVMMTRLQWVMT